jgi:hypothetical protein
MSGVVSRATSTLFFVRSRGMLQSVGFEVLAPQIIFGPVRMEDSQRKEALLAYAERLRNITNETPFDVGIY